MKKSTQTKRYTQVQLTRVFMATLGITDPLASKYQQIWWVNPTDPNSLRLSLEGLLIVKKHLQLTSYEFVLDDELSNHNLLQLERLFGGMYYLLKRQKIIVFEESEAVMLGLYASDLKTYLDNLERS